MSYSSNRRVALDSSLPVTHRASHARSCAVCVAEKYGLRRSNVVDSVRQACGVDLMSVKSGDDIFRAVEVLDRIRHEGLGDVTTA